MEENNSNLDSLSEFLWELDWKKILHPPTPQKIYHVFKTEIARYKHLGECERNNHGIGWGPLKHSIICTKCKIISAPEKTQWEEEELLHERAKQRYDRELKKHWNKYMKEHNPTQSEWLQLEQVLTAVLNGKRMSIDIFKRHSFWDTAKKMDENASILRSLDGFRHKHKVMWDEDASVFRCKLCNLILAQVSLKKVEEWKQEFIKKKPEIIASIFETIKECFIDLEIKKWNPTKEMMQDLELFFQGKEKQEIIKIKKQLGITEEKEKIWAHSKLYSEQERCKTLIEKKKEYTKLINELNILDMFLVLGRTLFLEKEKFKSLRNQINDQISSYKSSIRLLDKEHVRVRKELIKGNYQVQARSLVELSEEDLRRLEQKINQLKQRSRFSL